jgi:two-component system response regulator TrcR
MLRDTAHVRDKALISLGQSRDRRPTVAGAQATTAPSARARRSILGRLPRMKRPDGSPIRVLLVDDEAALASLVQRALQYEGWTIDIAHNAGEAVEMYHTNAPDVLVLDVMLPDQDGLGVLRQIRGSGRYTPVLLLTALDSMENRLVGLIAGGDDYMTKPFSLEELVARLRSILRRSAYMAAEHDESLNVGGLELNSGSRQVWRAGNEIELTATEFELLQYLMRHPWRAVRRDEILRHVWKYDFGGKSSIVDLYISYLRKKIDVGREPLIHTVRGVGYMLRPASDPTIATTVSFPPPQG